MKTSEQQITRNIRKWLIIFIVSLVISGITALDTPRGIAWLLQFNYHSFINAWLHQVADAVINTNRQYPFLFYGYDWLAFAHLVIAVAFIGPYKHPVRNKWVVQFGRIACLMIIPFALITGSIRGIPGWWQLIDCSFGILGLIPLSICYSLINKLEKLQEATIYGIQKTAKPSIAAIL
jgi:hypothetical protein